MEIQTFEVICETFQTERLSQTIIKTKPMFFSEDEN